MVMVAVVLVVLVVGIVAGIVACTAKVYKVAESIVLIASGHIGGSFSMMLSYCLAPSTLHFDCEEVATDIRQ